MTVETSFGRWLQRRRKALDLTQEELAQRVGCAAETLRKIEADARRPSRQIAERLAEALEIPEGDRTSFIKAARAELAVDWLRSPTHDIPQVTIFPTKTLSSEAVSFLFTQITSTFQTKPFDGRCPYKGLDVFEEEDAELFFGRENLVEDLVRRLEESRTIFIIGPSGSGKSSLVRAGLIHALKQGAIGDLNSERWLYETMSPGRYPIGELARVVSSMAQTTRAGEEVGANALADESIFSQWCEIALKEGRDKRAVLFVDQFEEVFTQVSNEEERLGFLNLLTHAATTENGRVIVLFAMRSDFVPNCAIYPQLNALFNQQSIQIGAMQPEELVSAIAQPALRVGLRIDPDLVAQIVNDMQGEPGALPLMQFALKDLFDAQQAKGGMIALTLNDYLQHGGIHKSLERHADDSFAKLQDDEQELARSIFSGLIEVGTGTQDTRRTALFDELIPSASKATDVKVVIQKLADARLITTDEQAGKDTVTISHEKLIDAWPWLKRLVNENREAIALQNEIAKNAKEWDEHEREPSYLYTGAKLANAREQLESKKIVLGGLPLIFIDSSQQSEESELRLEEQRHQKELNDARRLAEIEKQRAEEQADAGMQLRRRAVFLTAALIVAGILAFTAFMFAQRANQQSQRSFSRELAAAAISNLDIDPERSILLALRSISVAYTLEGEDALHQALKASHIQLKLSGHTEWVNRVAFSPDGTRLATSSDDGTAKVWDASSGKLLLTLESGHGDWVMGIAFSPDGTRLATVGGNETARVWDANTGQEILTLMHGMDSAYGIAFSPDGTKVAIAGPYAVAQVWDITRRQKLFTHRVQEPLWDIAFSPDGTRLATAGLEGTAGVWDANTGKSSFLFSGVHQLDSGNPFFYSWHPMSVAFSPSGRYLATAGEDRLVRVWNLSTGTELLTLSGHTSPVDSVVFSPDGTHLATAGKDQKAKIWELSYDSNGDLVRGQELFTLSGHTAPITGLAFHPGGTRLATASVDKSVRIWDISVGSSRELLSISAHEAQSTHVCYSPDGTRLAGVNSDGMVGVWDVDNGSQLLRLSGSLMNDVVFSPEGNSLVTTSEDGKVRIWDVASGKQTVTLSGHWRTVNDVTFSPDGTKIATVSTDGSAIIWDPRTGEQLFPLPPSIYDLLVAEFSPDSSRLAVGDGGGIVKIWDTTNGKSLLTLTSQVNTPESTWKIHDLAFSPDGSRLATGSEYGLTEIWDTKTGNLLLTFAGHTSEVTAVDFNPDGSWLATGSHDGTIKIWDIATGQNRLTLGDASEGRVTDVDFDPTGVYLAASGDSGIRVYTLQIEDLVALAKSRVTRSLTTEECQKYLHAEECSSVP